MSYNVPSGDTAKLSFGPGTIYLGPLGATPDVDVGYVKGDAELSVVRTLLEVQRKSSESRKAICYQGRS